MANHVHPSWSGRCRVRSDGIVVLADHTGLAALCTPQTRPTPPSSPAELTVMSSCVACRQTQRHSLDQKGTTTVRSFGMSRMPSALQHCTMTPPPVDVFCVRRRQLTAEYRTWLAPSVAAVTSQLPAVPHVVAVKNMPFRRRSARGTSRALPAHASAGDTIPAPDSGAWPLACMACQPQHGAVQDTGCDSSDGRRQLRISHAHAAPATDITADECPPVSPP